MSTVIQTHNYNQSLYAVGIHTQTHGAFNCMEGGVDRDRGLCVDALSHRQEIISMYLNPWQTLCVQNNFLQI